MKKKAKTITVKFTRNEAKKLGLLICTCGYPENNHFDFGKKTCAHTSNCKGYKEVLRWGKVVPPKKSPKKPKTKYCQSCGGDGMPKGCVKCGSHS